MLESREHLTENSDMLNGAKYLVLDRLSEWGTVFHVQAFSLSGPCLFVQTEFCPILIIILTYININNK